MSAKILLELITASFELNDQTTIQSLKLNAELLDLLIDLFSEDNLKELETSISFIKKIKYFSDKFYAKVNLKLFVNNLSVFININLLNY